MPLLPLEAELRAAPADDRTAVLQAVHAAVGHATASFAWESGSALLDTGGPRLFARHPELLGLLQTTNDAYAPESDRAEILRALGEVERSCGR